MNGNMRNPLGLLALLLALRSEGPEPRVTKRDNPRGYGPDMNLNPQDALEAIFGKDRVHVLNDEGLEPNIMDNMRVALHDFEELPNRARKVWESLLKQLNEIDVNNLDTVIVSVLVKEGEASTEPCKGCGEIHGAKTKLIGSVITSDPDLVPSLVKVTLAEAAKPENNQDFPTGEADFIERR